MKSKKKFVAVERNVYLAYYHYSWLEMKRLQRTGECKCPKSKVWYCDGDCHECEFYFPANISLDSPIEDEEIFLYEQIVGDDSCEWENFEIFEILNNLPDDEFIICVAYINGIKKKELKNMINYTGSRQSFYEYLNVRNMRLREKFKKYKNYY